MPVRGLAELLEALPGTGGYVKPLLEQLRTRPDAGGWWAEALPGTGKRAEACEALEQLQTVPLLAERHEQQGRSLGAVHIRVFVTHRLLPIS